MKRSLALLLLVCVLTGCVGVTVDRSASEADTTPTEESAPAPGTPVTPPAAEAPVAEPAPATPPAVVPQPDGDARLGVPPASRGRTPTIPVPTAAAPPAAAPVAPAPAGPELGAQPPGAPSLAEIVLGQTTDELGRPHSLVLTIPAAARNAVEGHSKFAVISGTRLAVTGDAAVGGWRFAVGSADSAPIVVVKTAVGQSVRQLAAEPDRYSGAVLLNDDAAATSLRLIARVDAVIAAAHLQQPHAALYTRLAADLTDPAWTGTVVFDATVATLPATVNGHPTGPAPDPRIPAVAVGFTSASGEYFGVVDYTRDPGSVPPGSIQYLNALFAGSALTAFGMG